jgi:hypothetical protein
MQRPVRPVRVVVIDVLIEDQPQMPFAGNQHPVQALAAAAGDPAFGDRVRARRPYGRLDDPDADRGEHRVECRGELGVPVPDQELEAVGVAFQGHEQVAGLLGHRCPRGVGGHASQVDAARTVLDEEQHVHAAQEHGAGVEEVRSEDRLGLPGRERPPGLPGSPGRGIDTCLFEDLPYRRWGELVAHACQLAMDAPVAPARVVPRHLQCQHAQGPRGSWVSRARGAGTSSAA